MLGVHGGPGDGRSRLTAGTRVTVNDRTANSRGVLPARPYYPLTMVGGPVPSTTAVRISGLPKHPPTVSNHGGRTMLPPTVAKKCYRARLSPPTSTMNDHQRRVGALYHNFDHTLLPDTLLSHSHRIAAGRDCQYRQRDRIGTGGLLRDSGRLNVGIAERCAAHYFYSSRGRRWRYKQDRETPGVRQTPARARAHRERASRVISGARHRDRQSEHL